MAQLLNKTLHIFLLGVCALIVLANAADQPFAPHLVSMRLRHNDSAPFLHRCTAVIYSKDYVLTPARCIVGLESQHLQIVAGTADRSEITSHVHDVDSYRVHPDFSIFFIDLDLAIISLKTPLALSTANGIQAIDVADAVPAGDTSASVGSWGTDAQGVKLHEVSVRVFSDAECKGVYGEDRVTSAMFCAAGGNQTENIIDSCVGDAGSALVSNGQAVGLVSWASFCGRKGHPNVYANLVDMKPWIAKETARQGLIQRILKYIKF